MVRRYGLWDVHVWPLVSQDKQLDGTFTCRRVPCHDAWAQLEIRTGNSWSGLVLDIDHPHAYERL